MNVDATARLSSGRAWIALVVALPAVFGSAVLARTAWHWIEPASPPGPESPQALLDAVASGDVSRAHGLIWAGQSANVPLPFSHWRLTSGRSVVVTPLLVAVARDDENMVRMLLTHGAIADDPRNRLAACLAPHVGDGIAGAFTQAAGRVPTASGCPNWQNSLPRRLDQVVDDMFPSGSIGQN